MKYFLLAHLVGDDQDQAIAFLRGHQSKAEAGIAGGRLDQGSAASQLARRFRGLDQRTPDPILDRTGGILVFELGKEPAWASIEMGKLDQGCVADGIEYAVMDLHAISLSPPIRKVPPWLLISSPKSRSPIPRLMKNTASWLLRRSPLMAGGFWCGAG